MLWYLLARSGLAGGIQFGLSRDLVLDDPPRLIEHTPPEAVTERHPTAIRALLELIPAVDPRLAVIVTCGGEVIGAHRGTLSEHLPAGPQRPTPLVIGTPPDEDRSSQQPHRHQSHGR